MAPAVSVVLPVRDASASLGRALASVRSQSFADWELLAVDDGSTDATPATPRRRRGRGPANPRVEDTARRPRRRA